MNDPMKRDHDLQYLHPHFRHKAVSVLRDLDALGAPFHIFESYRSPERQRKLYAKRPRVTKANPWRSLHQYGVAADFVLKLDGRWSWSTQTQEHRDWWDQLHQVAAQHGLIPISWEKPHLQLAGVSIKDLRKGRYPDGGDDPWVWNLNGAILRYSKGAPPLAEYDDEVSRPSTIDGLDERVS